MFQMRSGHSWRLTWPCAGKTPRSGITRCGGLQRAPVHCENRQSVAYDAARLAALVRGLSTDAPVDGGAVVYRHRVCVTGPVTDPARSCSSAERQHSCFQIHRHSGDSEGCWAHQTVNVELRGFWVASQQSRLLPELLRAQPESTQPNLLLLEVRCLARLFGVFCSGATGCGLVEQNDGTGSRVEEKMHR